MEVDVWTPLLRAGERVLWQASVTEDRYLAEASRQRMLGLIIGGAAILAAGMFGVSLIEMLAVTQAAALFASLNRVLLLPIYVVAILASIAIAIGQVSRLKTPRPVAVSYAVTTERVLAVNEAGVLVDALEGNDIAGLELIGGDEPRSLSLRRKPGSATQRLLSIAYVDRLAEARTVIGQTFRQPAS